MEDLALFIAGGAILVITGVGIILALGGARDASDLERISGMADEELDRIERHGGTSGFAKRIKKVSDR